MKLSDEELCAWLNASSEQASAYSICHEDAPKYRAAAVRIEALKAQLAIAREALRFYRDEWEQDWDDPFPMPSEEMAEDEGDRARRALANMEANHDR